MKDSENLLENDLLSHDLARHLSRLTIKTFGVELEADDRDEIGLSLVQEVGYQSKEEQKDKKTILTISSQAKLVLRESSNTAHFGNFVAGAELAPSCTAGLYSFCRSRLTVLELMALVSWSLPRALTPPTHFHPTVSLRTASLPRKSHYINSILLQSSRLVHAHSTLPHFCPTQRSCLGGTSFRDRSRGSVLGDLFRCLGNGFSADADFPVSRVFSFLAV